MCNRDCNGTFRKHLHGALTKLRSMAELGGNTLGAVEVRGGLSDIQDIHGAHCPQLRGLHLMRFRRRKLGHRRFCYTDGIELRYSF